MPNSNAFSIASKILTREVSLGENLSCFVEMVLIPFEASTWVILREAQGQSAATNQPVLRRSFELICTILRYELVHIKGLVDDLQFFHAEYHMRPTSYLNWGVSSVRLLRAGEHYTYATWHPVDDTQQMLISAALHSWAPPQRRVL